VSKEEKIMERLNFRLIAPLALAIVSSATYVAAAQPRDFFVEETHFRCYIVSQQTPQAATTVTLTDQFLENVTLTVNEPLQFCAPTSKNGVEITRAQEEEHLTMYGAAANLVPHLIVETVDQFGPRTLEVVAARVLLVPTQKLTVDGVVTKLDEPTKLNHFWCYEVNGEPVDQDVTLEDQFRSDKLRVEQPVLFCNPVEKRVGGKLVGKIVEEEVHVTCYDLHGPQRTEATRVGIKNQLETDTFTITAFELLCVPSAKGEVRPEG
jgi:hypothetical protein